VERFFFSSLGTGPRLKQAKGGFEYYIQEPPKGKGGLIDVGAEGALVEKFLTQEAIKEKKPRN